MNKKYLWYLIEFLYLPLVPWYLWHPNELLGTILVIYCIVLTPYYLYQAVPDLCNKLLKLGIRNP